MNNCYEMFLFYLRNKLGKFPGINLESQKKYDVFTNV